MNVIVTGQHLEVSDTPRAHINQKISRVIRHKERIADHHQADGGIKTLSEKSCRKPRVQARPALPDR